MYFSDLLEIYLFKQPYSKESLQYFEVSYFYSVLIFLISLLAKSLGYGIVSNLNFYSFFIMFLWNLFIVAIGIFLFIVWMAFFVAISKKIMVLKNYLFIILTSFSSFILLLPLSIIFYYFNLKSLFILVDVILSIHIFTKILKKTSVYFNFSNTQMFLIVFLPFLLIFLVTLVLVVIILFFVYGQI